MTNKKLYIWTTADKLALAPITGELVVKIGDAYDTDSRVLGEGIDLSKREMLRTYDIGDKRDYDYHAEAERAIYDIRRLAHHVECETREGFAVPIDPTQSPDRWKLQVIHLVDSIVAAVGGTPEEVEFVPTTWQMRAIEHVANSLDQGKKTLLLELAARFGKTGTLLTAFAFSTAEVMTVATYVKTVSTSFAKTIAKFFASVMTYVDVSDPDFEQSVKDALASGKKVVIGCSLFDSRRLQKRIDFISSLEDNLVVVDEADFGAHTDSNREKVNTLRQGVPLILMTGTNADRAASSHSVDAHMSTTYFDMLLDA